MRSECIPPQQIRSRPRNPSLILSLTLYRDPQRGDHKDTMSPLQASLLTLLLYTGGALSQVHVPQGPLLRVEGSAVALWCNSSGPLVSGFEWSVIPAHPPRHRLQIVSSVDQDFSYAVYRDRVTVRREIYLEKVRRDASRLHLLRLQARDTGDYECYAPNTPHTYYGGHSANVRLTVIPDSLQVSLLSPADLTLSEDARAVLTCEVVSVTPQHTHVSVTWFQRSAGSSRPIASLSRESITSVASAFMTRDPRPEKVSTTLYRLTLSAEHGQYYCQATEWIQDPDKSWYPLSTKRSCDTTLHLHAADVMSAVYSSTTQTHPPWIFYPLMFLPPLVAAAY
ncbi:immunoglobulin superfamily member 3-like isoform X2 [Hyla sarda]|uniref:immunoglobulin superfamily member 3-like isoform X2 n=1 Tax=Hyla sarda TaxID=327740 RepID=UPI0024C29AA5|nr:immunoglobulin superfamily member 3-like isoform X2 [Hyla sarda]